MFAAICALPHAALRLGMLPKLKRSEMRLYIGLLHDSERCRTRELARTDADLQKLVGGSGRGFRDARIKLQEYGLIRFVARRGNVYVYTLCDPATGKPWAGDPKVQVRYVPKSMRPNSANGSSSPKD